MKKIPAAFLISIIIFAFFMVISLLKTPSSSNSVTTATPVAPQIPPLRKTTACIVIINSQKYDVSQYRNQHQGGNIFQCNTDMSAVFAGQHSQSYLNKMKRYLIP